MQKDGINRKYELVLIVDARLSNEEKEEIWKQSAEIVTKGGGKVLNSRVWLEKHKFTFTIKKLKEGTYYLVEMEGPGSLIQQIEPALKLNDKILRFFIIEAGSCVPSAG